MVNVLDEETPVLLSVSLSTPYCHSERSEASLVVEAS
jgi:hypothetical protein